ncbi:hypothetical protein CHLNCDRAFT_143823 [Chlorella variabilis]|uniref:Peptidase C1A papain C-terminal domain-containing protein n=1 Tax=Chlorella variabilis TaxID=554065 RepID=E1ZAI4_CHLVA|nr:hypothetical protein CHLNCDRAFT_143823 [Chlorella variabilis]EFN57070.1 hypothetical protein CHLNCDRAFT_143823 [Chlorella variabilis]|eukprot:XP_005849172.1 hypothetical protein CHLNCDRAFT_143823 [Chlorella variabilis]
MRALQGALYRVLLAATLWALLAAAAKPQTKGYKNKEEARTAAAQLQALASAERRQLFNDWKAEYGKNFGANGSQLDNLKFSKWSARLDAVIEHNKAAVYSFKGLNRFSELSFREFSSKWLMTPKDPAELAGRVPVPGGGSRRLLADPPAALDWRTQGVDLPIRDQGGCGACWAFAAIAAVEAKALILGTATDISTLDLSEQQLVDCAKSGTLDYWSLGCESGYSDDALWYLSDYYGTTEARYPFQGVIVGYNATKGVGSNESYWIVRNQWGDWGEAGHIRVQMTQAGACSMPPLGGLTRSPPPPRPRPQIEAVMRDAALWRGFTGVWDTLSSPSLTADTRLLTSGLNTQLAVHFRAGLADPKRRYVRAALFASTAVDRATAALLPPNATAGTGWKLKVTVNGRVLKPADAAPMGGGEVVRTFPAAKGRSARMAILTPKMRISMNVASKTSAADQQRFGKWLNVRVTVFRTQILPKPVLGLFGPSYIAARG